MMKDTIPLCASFCHILSSMMVFNTHHNVHCHRALCALKRLYVSNQYVHASHNGCHRQRVRRLCIRYVSSSSSSRRRNKSTFQLDALPFTVTPTDANTKFEQWSADQGIGPLLSIGSTKLTAAYTPFWYFNINAVSILFCIYYCMFMLHLHNTSLLLNFNFVHA